MSENERIASLERALEQYPAALDPSQVAQALGVTRRYVDKLIDDGKIECFVLDETKLRKEKRVTKATLIAFMMSKQN